MSRLPIPLFAMLSIVACAPVASNEPPPGASHDDDAVPTDKPRTTGGSLPPEEQIRVGPGLQDASCRAEDAQRFVGQTADAATLRAAMAASGAKSVRVIKPGMMVTMVFNGDRLSVRVDEAGRILAANCG
jgi:Peptidase inhibitor I78 family